jgi:hypothetical protein
LSFVTMLRAGSALRALVFAGAALALAACGDDADTTTPSAATPAPAAQAPAPTAVVSVPAPVAVAPAPVIATPAPAAGQPAVAPEAPAMNATAVDVALLLGNWAPDAATCAQGLVMTVTSTTIAGAALGAAECTIDSRSRSGNDVTVAATCSSPDAAFRSLRMTLNATIVGDALPAAIAVLQEGQGLAAAARQPMALIRCAAAPTP